tara:strand:+ start:115 stop:387 length:273 start_codon:yes stop_codon:yes gene_type:complete
METTKTRNKRGAEMQVILDANKRGMVSMSKGRKVRGQDKFHVVLEDNQGRVYETKKTYALSTIKKYFNEGRYVIFTRDQVTGQTTIKRVG